MSNTATFLTLGNGWKSNRVLVSPDTSQCICYWVELQLIIQTASVKVPGGGLSMLIDE